MQITIRPLLESVMDHRRNIRTQKKNSREKQKATKIKQVRSGNTTITHCRPTHGTIGRVTEHYSNGTSVRQ